jgi:predicted ATPase/class 3 adenylate cyclase/Tfp pilus assembly protein PilF
MQGVTRALLVSDVVESTKLAGEVGDARMAEIWVAHDRAVRDLLPAWRGVEADRTDGFLLLFDEVADAVGFAGAFHAAMGALASRFDVPFGARVGVHWGSVLLLETSAEDRARGAKPLEVEGVAKAEAARLMALAVAGQTLISGSARERLGSDAIVASHGFWKLRGAPDAMELFELASPGAPLRTPPDGAAAWRVARAGDLWLPVRDVKRCLPGEADAFVGRRRDLHDLGALVGEGRLVTVLGPGGTGKTRLVTRFGWTCLGDWAGGVWFCDLSEARDVAGIVSALGRTLDVPLGPGDPVVQLGHAIAGRGQCLVVFDNFEQVAHLAASTLGLWLDRAADARFVVTSRQLLGLRGEMALHLGTLDAEDAIELFATRARHASEGFVLAGADRAAVAQLVRLVDGLPLAIELAAARAPDLPPQALLERMSQRFDLLASSGGRHARQATLRATLDWSWELLGEDERAAWAQLSVFEGGFTLEAAEVVLSLADTWPTDAVQTLVDKSLVRRVSDSRFDLLVSVRDYGAERLDASGSRGATELRHGQHYAQLGHDEQFDALDRRGGAERRRAYGLELGNLVVACRRAVARQDAEVAPWALRAAWAVLWLRGPFRLGADLAMEASRIPLPPRARSVVSRVLAMALEQLGGAAEARAHFDAALAAAREAGDRGLESSVLGNLGLLHKVQGRPEEAVAHYEAALALAREAGDGRFEGVLLGNLGNVRRDHGRPEEARACYEAALARVREEGDARTEGIVLGNLGLLHKTQGRAAEARTHLEAALARAREAGDRRFEGTWLGNLANLHRDLERFDDARRCYDDALLAARDVGDRRIEAIVLGNLGSLDQAEGRREDAAARYRAALAVAGEVGPRFEGYVLASLGGLHVEQGQLDDARAAFYAAEPLLRSGRSGADLAQLLCGRARLEAAEGRVDAARAALAEAEDLVARAGAGPDTELGRTLAVARAAVGDERRDAPGPPTR